MTTILIITDNLPDQINGVVTTFTNLARIGEAEGFRVVFLTPNDFFYADCPGYNEVKLSIPFFIGSKIEKINPDYIHIATEGPIGLMAKFFLDKKKWKYNTSYHTKFPEFLYKLYGIPQDWTYWYVRWFHKHSGKILTTTKTMVDELKSHGFKGEIISLGRGVDRNIFDSHHRNKTHGVTLLHVGRISKEKGIDDFCLLSFPGATKIVVGNGPYLAELQKKYPNIIFVGKKTGKELAWYFSNADVFVFTSKVDTFGIVIIESLSVGTPVAAYKVPGPIDILEPGINGAMNNDLLNAVKECLLLDRTMVKASSNKWTWEQCWTTFKYNLVSKSD